MTKRTLSLAPFVLSAAMMGCGGGDSGGGRHITWKDDGTSEKAIVTLAMRGMQGTSDYLNLLGTNSSVGITIVVGATGRSLGAETFTCNQTASDQTVTLTYSDADGGTLPTIQGCTVAVTQAGVLSGGPATGTFSAVFNLASGGTKSITEGSFNVPISM
jgi:hypothetical protein